MGSAVEVGADAAPGAKIAGDWTGDVTGEELAAGGSTPPSFGPTPVGIGGGAVPTAGRTGEIRASLTVGLATAAARGALGVEPLNVGAGIGTAAGPGAGPADGPDGDDRRGSADADGSSTACDAAVGAREGARSGRSPTGGETAAAPFGVSAATAVSGALDVGVGGDAAGSGPVGSDSFRTGALGDGSVGTVSPLADAGDVGGVGMIRPGSGAAAAGACTAALSIGSTVESGPDGCEAFERMPACCADPMSAHVAAAPSGEGGFASDDPD